MAPFWAVTDPYLAFKSGYSKVYHQVYRNTRNNSAQSSYILSTASKHVQLYEKSGNFRNFQASWVLVVTWKNLCPYVYYRRLYYDDNQEILRLNCSWVRILLHLGIAKRPTLVLLNELLCNKKLTDLALSRSNLSFATIFMLKVFQKCRKNAYKNSMSVVMRP